MAAPTAVLLYGDTALTLGEAPRIVRRKDGFDEGAFTFLGGLEESLPSGGVVPGYSGMYVGEDDVTDHSGDLEHNVRAVGLRSGATRRIASSAVDSEDGFDIGSETWIVSEGQITTFQRGRVHADHTQLFCISVAEKSSPVDYYRVLELSFKGIKNGTRPDRYKFTTAAREITRENMAITSAGGDGANLHTWNIYKGDPIMQRSYVSQSRPNFANIGTQGLSVDNFPAWAQFNWTTNDTVSYQWPNGVILAAIESEEIPGRTLNFVTETYIHRDKITLG